MPLKPSFETLAFGSQNIEIMRCAGADRPHAILLPGARGGLRSYRDFAEMLAAKGIPSIGINPRGCGASDGLTGDMTLRDLARDVLKVAARETAAPLLLVGHAGGNRIARMATTLEPDRVAGIVLVAAGGMIPAEPEAAAARAKLVAGEYSSRAEERALMQTCFFAPDTAIPDWYFDVPDHSYDYARAFIKCQETVPVEEWWGGGGKRMLVIQGKQDRTAPPRNGHGLQAEFPDRVRCVDIDDAGHILTLEQPGIITDLIVGFAAEVQVPLQTATA